MKTKFNILISSLLLLSILAACTPVEGVLEVQIEPATQARSEAPLSEIKPIAKMILSGMMGDLINRMQFLTTPCTIAEGLGGPPKCEEGQADGTLVEVFPVGGPEGSFSTPEQIDSVLNSLAVKNLYAVYEVPADVYQETYWPAGEYALIFDRDLNDIPMPITARVQDGKLVRLDFHFGVTAAEVLQSIPVERVNVPPSAIESWLYPASK